jgi:DNA modification methylase
MAKKAKIAPAPLVADEIQIWPIDRVKPNPLNSREHSDAQVGQLVGSFEEFGQVWPVLVDEKDMLIAGEGRWKAAQKREQATIKVIVARGWSVAKKRAFVILDNKLGENSTWNRERLSSEVGNLNQMGFDVSLLGFTTPEIKAMIANAIKPLHDAEDAPVAPAAPVSRLGDLWLCGAHRVLCGDSTSKAAVDRVLDGAKPHLMVTDPPYGVEYDPAWRGKVQNANGTQLSTGKGRAVGTVKNDERADWREAWALFPGVVAYVWHSGKHATEVGVSLEAAKFLTRSQIVWVKNNLVVGRSDYHWQHEAAFYATRQDSLDDHWRFEEQHEAATYAVKLGGTARWCGGRKQSTVWDDIPALKNTTGHGTQKPVECMRRPILNNSVGGDCVYDPFLGSGTTLVAAHQEGRICLGLELAPAYVDVIVERWAALTGLPVIHEATGKTFAETKAERHGGKKTRTTLIKGPKHKAAARA